VAFAGGNSTEEGVGHPAARDLLDKRPALIGVYLLKYSVKVGRDGATIEQARQQRYCAGDILRSLEVAFEIEIEAILAECLDEVVHHALVVAAGFETLPHGRGVEASVIAKSKQVLLPLRATSAFGHTGTDKGDDEAPLARPLQFLEPHKIAWKLVGVEDAGLRFLIEPLGLLVVQCMVAEVKCTARLCERNFLLAAFTDDLDVFVLLVVDDLVKAAVLADSSQFLEGGFVIKSGFAVVRHRLGLRGDFNNKSVH